MQKSKPKTISKDRLYALIKKAAKRKKDSISDAEIGELVERVRLEDGQIDWYEVLETPSPRNSLLIQSLLDARVLLLDCGFEGKGYGVFYINYMEKKVPRLSAGTCRKFKSILFATQADAEEFADAWRGWNPEDEDVLYIEEISRRLIKKV